MLINSPSHFITELKIHQIISSPRDEILQRSERKMKVVNQKYNKNKPIILRSIVFQLC